MRLPLLAVILLRTAAVAAPVERLSDFELTDQNAKTRSYRFRRRSPDDRRRSQGSDQLRRDSSARRYRKRIDIDGVADVSMIPKLFHGMFREAFRKKLTYSVMLDWEGSVVKEFGYTKGVANIYVIDRSGRRVQQVTGAMRDAPARELFDQIDRVLENPSQK
jgi:hypothetical protein